MEGFDWLSAIETLSGDYVALEQTRLTGATPEASKIAAGVPRSDDDSNMYQSSIMNGIDSKTLMIGGGLVLGAIVVYLAVK